MPVLSSWTSLSFDFEPRNSSLYRYCPAFQQIFKIYFVLFPLVFSVVWSGLSSLLPEIWHLTASLFCFYPPPKKTLQKRWNSEHGNHLPSCVTIHQFLLPTFLTLNLCLYSTFDWLQDELWAEVKLRFPSSMTMESVTPFWEAG